MRVVSQLIPKHEGVVNLVTPNEHKRMVKSTIEQLNYLETFLSTNTLKPFRVHYEKL